MKIRNIFLLAFPFLLTGCVAYFDTKEREKQTRESFSVTWNASVGTKYSDLSYGSGSYNKYDLFVPTEHSEKSTHLILYTHGGGWTSGSKDSGDVYCKYFTSKGYVTASIDYTLSDGINEPTITSINDELLAAVSEIKNKAHELGYELVDMANFGFSAGGCQSIFYAFKERTTSPLPVRFVLDWSGPTSFNPDHWSAEAGTYPPELNLLGLDGSNAGKAGMVQKFSGQTCTADMIADGSAEAIWNSISPLHYVDGSIPPLIICYGSYDGIVPVIHQRLLIEALDEAGVEYHAIEFKNSGHGLHCDPNKMNEFKQKADEYCARYFN